MNMGGEGDGEREGEREGERDFGDYLAMLRARDAFVRMLGIELVSAAPGQATATLRLRESHINFFGVAHGGVVFSLADTAFGAAANAGDRLSAMVDAHLALTAGSRLGDFLRADAELASESRQLAVYRVRVTRDRGDGAQEIAAFTGTVFRTERPAPR